MADRCLAASRLGFHHPFPSPHPFPLENFSRYPSSLAACSSTPPSPQSIQSTETGRKSVTISTPAPHAHCAVCAAPLMKRYPISLLIPVRISANMLAFSRDWLYNAFVCSSGSAKSTAPLAALSFPEKHSLPLPVVPPSRFLSLSPLPDTSPCAPMSLSSMHSVPLTLRLCRRMHLVR